MARDVKALTWLLGVAGVLHFVAPKPFEQIVPEPLPAKRELVYASGVVEVAAAALLARPATRPLGGRLATLLLVSVFPANVQMTVSAFRDERTPRWFAVGTLLRLPLQIPMVLIARKAARSDT